jgi:UPF0716 protein FxsA
MRSFSVVFLLFPLLELWLLIKVGAWLGALPTVTLVVLSTLLGVAVLRRVGWQTVSLAQQSMTQRGLRQQASPLPVLFDGFALALAGVLLVLPGLLSDIVGLLLLIAPLRRWLLRGALPGKRLRSRYAVVGGVAAAARQPGMACPDRPAAEDRPAPAVIDGEYRREP